MRHQLQDKPSSGFGRYLMRVAERDVDLVLMEEFHACHAFTLWFCANWDCLKCVTMEHVMGKRWLCAPATVRDGRLLAPHSLGDAQSDLGDSAIMEAFDLGRAVAHCSPELAHFMLQD